jgi:peptidoglycan/LPS O-acetylase OafA/YrhL
MPGLAAAVGAALVVLPALLLVPADSLTFGYTSLAGQMWLRPVAASGFALLVLASASPGGLRSALEWAPLRWLGDRSYSIYLLHIVAILGAGLAFGVEDRPVFAGLSVLASITAGAALYAAVEAPAERWRHRRKLRLRTATDPRPVAGA